MTTLQQLAAELVDDEIGYFEEDGMTVHLTPEQVAELKQQVLESLCNAFNDERDALNDYIRAHARTPEQEEEAKNA